MVSHSSALRERYEAEGRLERLRNNGRGDARPINNEPRNRRSGGLPDNGGSRNGRHNNQRFSNSPDRNRVIPLTRIVFDWWFMEEKKDDNKVEKIFIPILTDLYYSDQMGGKANIQHFDQWKKHGWPLRIDAIDHNGRIHRRTDKYTRELSDFAQMAHEQMVEAVVAMFYDPKPEPKKSRHCARWFFGVSFILNVLLILYTIGVT